MNQFLENAYIYLNNNFVKSDIPLIDINDRGFRFGDGVFETIRVRKFAPFRIDNHLNRLNCSLKAVKIDFDVSPLKNICLNLLKKNNIESGFLRIAISRGVGSVGYLPSEDNKPTLLVQTLDDIYQNNEPVSLWLSSYRKIPDICLPANAKTAQGLNSTLARLEAQENEHFEALLLSVNDLICEGSSGNIFWYKQNKLYTPKNNILKGVMRQAIIENSPYEVIQGDFEINELKSAEEVFITNVAWMAKSVKSLSPSGIIWNKQQVCQQINEIINKAV